MRIDVEATAAMAAGLERIRHEAGVPEEFPPDVLAAAQLAAQRQPSSEHRDRTGERFVTLDPATSIDLDQAFAIETAGDELLLHYAIADVGWFVHPGDSIDLEGFRRAVTVYLPDRRSTLYPQVLSENAASLLPNVDRPAVVFTVRIASDGHVRLDGVERALIRSTAKLAYDTVADDNLPQGFAEIHRRVVAAEERRHAVRVEFPEQHVERRADDRYVLQFRPRLESEERNAALSLATNLAVAELLFAAGTGLFRVMPDVDRGDLHKLRLAAQAFGLEWAGGRSLDDFVRSLPRDDPRTSAFLIAVRRASGGASYEPFRGTRPWHSAVAATYAHATAPLRRLQDRYVIEAALALATGEEVPGPISVAFGELPAAMSRGEQRANRVERQALDLAEAVVLAGHEGHTFSAVVIDEGEWGVEFQIAEPAVLGRLQARHVDPGDSIRVRLERVDVTMGHVEFVRVA